MNRAQSVTHDLMDDIWEVTGLTPHILGRLVIVCDNYYGQYVVSSRDSGLPDGSSLMLVHDQSDLGGDNSLLLDLTDLDGSVRSLTRTSALVCERINAQQQTLQRLTEEAS